MLQRLWSARCLSWQTSQRVCPGIASLEQSLHCPSALRLARTFFSRSLMYFFRSGFWLLALSYACLACFLSSSLRNLRDEVPTPRTGCESAVSGWFSGFG